MDNEKNTVPKPEEIGDLPPVKKKTSRKHKVLSETEIKLKKAKRTRVGIAAFVLLLAVGVMGNWYYENSNISETIEPLISQSSKKTLGEAEYVGATTKPSTESEYFSSARMERQKSRDEALEKLQAVIDSQTENNDVKKRATNEIARLSSNISAENKIETLVTAKGVNNCLAIINESGDRVDVIVDVDELTDSIIMQIKDIAMEQMKVSFENISIIQSKS